MVARLQGSAALALGRLSRIDVREVWSSEAVGFTPWLAQEENLQLLAETIKMQLILEAKEKPVGMFRADIIPRDVHTGHPVLIENQLERTNHMDTLDSCFPMALDSKRCPLCGCPLCSLMITEQRWTG